MDKALPVLQQRGVRMLLQLLIHFRHVPLGQLFSKVLHMKSKPMALAVAADMAGYDAAGFAALLVSTSSAFARCRVTMR